MKKDSLFVCQNCGYKSVKWLGRCPTCGEWNTFYEERETAPSGRRSGTQTKPLAISEVTSSENKRIPTGIPEFDRVLGGGLVPGCCLLISGEPGIGKSTLLLQVANSIASKGKKVLYLSGEEVPTQVRMRADRLKALSENLFVSFQANLEEIISQVDDFSPDVFIVDSIQSVYLPEIAAGPGSVMQVRECASRLFEVAKSKEIPLILVGHVTKEGSIAGPKLLEHLVDVVLYFEGDRMGTLRMLRAQKNRFGDTMEIGLFEMSSCGLLEVKEGENFLPEGPKESVGTVLSALVEGARVIPVAVQALVSPSYLTVPRRIVSGFDFNRLLVILAILEKSAHLHFQGQDVYINIASGLRLFDPSCDLAVALAIYSSLEEVSFPPLLALGELGLAGELRPVPNLERRIQQAERLGISLVLCPPPRSSKSEQVKKGEQVQFVSSIGEALAVCKKFSKGVGN